MFWLLSAERATVLFPFSEGMLLSIELVCIKGLSGDVLPTHAPGGEGGLGMCNKKRKALCGWFARQEACTNEACAGNDHLAKQHRTTHGLESGTAAIAVWLEVVQERLMDVLVSHVFFAGDWGEMPNGCLKCSASCAGGWPQL